MTSVENGGTTTRNVFSGDKQKVENLQNKINELIARLEIAENRIEGLRVENLKVNAAKEEMEKLVKESEKKIEPEIKKDFSGVKGAEEDEPESIEEPEEVEEKTVKPKKSKK